MVNYAEKFKNDRYVYVEGLLSEEECDTAVNILINSHENGNSVVDNYCKKSISFNKSELSEIHYNKKELFENILNMKLVPTYNFSRIYKPGEILKKHIDRYACEISVSITLGYVGDIWPIYFLDRNESAENIFYHLEQKQYTQKNSGDESFSPFMNTANKLKFKIKKGAGVFYRGCELIHWRDEYVEGLEQAQVFFHYVNANGPYRDLNFDKQSYDFNQMLA